jgi:hypothetical protein
MEKAKAKEELNMNAGRTSHSQLNEGKLQSVFENATT